MTDLEWEAEFARRRLLCANINVRLAKGRTELKPSARLAVINQAHEQLNDALDEYLQAKATADGGNTCPVTS